MNQHFLRQIHFIQPWNSKVLISGRLKYTAGNNHVLRRINIFICLQVHLFSSGSQAAHTHTHTFFFFLV